MNSSKSIQLAIAILASIAIFTTINLVLFPLPIIEAAEIRDKTTKTYKPKPGRKRTQARKPGGYRGNSCALQDRDPVTLLVPEDHIPLTTSERPTFFWYVNTVSHPIRFTIYEPGQPTPLYVQNITPTMSGIVAFTLPPAAKSLKIGKQYRWTVSVICNQLRPSENIYAKAWIERVENLKTLDRKSSCLLYYARSGIWYDALSCRTNSTKEFWSLLSQVQLSAIATEQPQITFIN